jgi:hypothetical protein
LISKSMINGSLVASDRSSAARAGIHSSVI